MESTFKKDLWVTGGLFLIIKNAQISNQVVLLYSFFLSFDRYFLLLIHLVNEKYWLKNFVFYYGNFRVQFIRIMNKIFF